MDNETQKMSKATSDVRFPVSKLKLWLDISDHLKNAKRKYCELTSDEKNKIQLDIYIQHGCLRGKCQIAVIFITLGTYVILY